MAFVKGMKRPAGAGRKKGSLNKENADVRRMILTALENVGGIKYLEQQAVHNPPAFLSLIKAVTPKPVEMTVEGKLNLTVMTGVPTPDP